MVGWQAGRLPGLEGGAGEERRREEGERKSGKGGGGPAPIVCALIVERISAGARQAERRTNGDGDFFLSTATSCGGSSSTPDCKGCLVRRKAHKRWAVTELAARDLAVTPEGRAQRGDANVHQPK